MPNDQNGIPEIPKSGTFEEIENILSVRRNIRMQQLELRNSQLKSSLQEQRTEPVNHVCVVICPNDGCCGAHLNVGGYRI